MPPDLAANLCSDLIHTICRPQRGACFREQPFFHCGQPHSLGYAVEQLHAQFILQRLDLGADCLWFTTLRYLLAALFSLPFLLVKHPPSALP